MMRPEGHPRYDFDPNNHHKLVLQKKGRKPPFELIGICGPWEEDLLDMLEGDWLGGEARKEALRIKREKGLLPH